MMDSQTKLKRVVIKEELVILTGDHIKALILNQFLYWSERTKDYDKFIAEEKERFSPEDKDLNVDFTFGWIYKTAEELIEELMLNISAVTARRHLTKLIKAGYIDQRHNPNHKWDRTLQYRPNIIAIQKDLEAMGYALDGYPLLMKDATFKLKVGNNNLKVRTSINEGAIPEITTETTTETISPNAENGSLTNAEKETTKQIEPNIPDKLTNQQVDELLIFGKHPDSDVNPIFDIIQEIQSTGWEIRNHIVEQAIAHYLEAVREHHPAFVVPNNKGVRNGWYKDVNGHLQDYRVDDLPELYRMAIEKHAKNKWKFTRPGSLTNTLTDVALEVGNSDGVVAWL